MVEQQPSKLLPAPLLRSLVRRVLLSASRTQRLRFDHEEEVSVVELSREPRERCTRERTLRLIEVADAHATIWENKKRIAARSTWSKLLKFMVPRGGIEPPTP